MIHRNNSRAGFTLMEMLIVVAIIAILVAVMIPTLSGALEKAREATDLANIRSAYAEIQMNVLMEKGSAPYTIELKQLKAGWMTDSAANTLENLTDGHVEGEPGNGSGNTAVIEWLDDEQILKITFSGEGSGSGSKAAPPTRQSSMKSIAAGLQKGLQQLIPAGKEAQAASCLHSDSYTASNGDLVSVRELHISESTLENGVYWTDKKHSWRQLLEEAGTDLSGLEDQDGYVYLDSNYNPVSVSYYDVDGKYCYAFIESGKTYVLNKMPGERQHAGYYEDYAESLAK